MRIATASGIIASAILATASAFGSSGASAADLGGSCCTDLEERIAELEATTVRKGNRKVSLTIAGQVNKAFLGWDDGFEDNVYVVGNKNDQTNLMLTGEAEIASGWRAGYDITIRFVDNLSDLVSQDTVNDGEDLFIWQNHWWIESKHLGKLSLGRASRATDTVPETDLSETAVAAYAGVQDIGGHFNLRLSNGVLAPVVWGDVYNHFNGDTADLVRYDTREYHGFVGSATWGDDDVWDVALRYTHEGGGLNFGAAIGYTELTDGRDELIGNPLGLAQSTLVGSLSLLHTETGLNVTFAAGNRTWDQALIDLDGVTRTPKDSRYIYTKLGWLAKLNSLGPTGFYAEYGLFKDYICATDNVDLLDALNATGAATRIAGNEADVWGVGLVQQIEAAQMQLYIGYRHHTASFDLVDGAGNAVAARSVEDFDTVIAGSKISF